MAKAFRLSVVAPDRTVVDDQVTSVVAPGVEGYLGVMADHEASIVALRAGVVEALGTDNQREHIAIGPGFLEVSGGSCIILVDDARRAKEIDVAEENQILERARRTLRGEQSDMTMEQAQQELDRAMARLRVAKGG
ncbi:MAG: ATP synthase F1 subunit epsilon [Fimbriimonadaceae bacterium]|nr:ATP synthase F1 subunit epsilon [Fimbriimonadaceae bacterium]QYK56114.1 MAG: ATP synthase F1 subunit epsilon [Fimbriimonadaceae bacterium]